MNRANCTIELRCFRSKIIEASKINIFRQDRRQMKRLSWRRVIVWQTLLFIVAVSLVCIWLTDLPHGPEYSDEYYFETDQNIRKNTIAIYSEEEWISFSGDISNGINYDDYEVILVNDLDFSEYSLDPVGNYQNPFSGFFNGNGHTIYNISMHSDEMYVGLFAVAEYAYIYDVTLENCNIESTEAIGTGGIIGFADNSEVKNCKFNGYVYGHEGSVGGIVGNNWSQIKNCAVSGEIMGSTQSGSYSLQWEGNSFGTGGISGDNGSNIYCCKNYANVYDDVEEHESNNSRCGGVSGYNRGTVASCLNYGNVTGGGIVKSNKEYGQIRNCFNFGNVYSGIAISSCQDSIIEFCGNFGETAGRYAGDIVSFWGQDSEINTGGKISQCLYINSSGAGVARHHSFGTASLENNTKVANLVGKDEIIFHQLIENNDYQNAYKYLLDREYIRRKTVSTIIIIVLITIIVVTNVSHFSYEGMSKKQIYKRGKMFFEKKDYWEAYTVLSRVQELKDANQLMKKSLKIIISSATVKDAIDMGCYLDEKLSWIVVKKDNEELVFLSKKALLASSINDSDVDVEWNNSKLYKDLNTVYKNQWFGEKIDNYINIEISLPKINVVKEIFPDNELRKCKGVKKMDSVFVSNGNVYWWLLDENSTRRMPFVTAEGLVSERGRSVITNNIAVRPIIIIKDTI